MKPNILQQLFSPKEDLPVGVFHYQSPLEDPRNYRLHLRTDPAGGGVLIINASTILHLNQTAAEYAYFLVNNTDPDTVARRMSAKYQVAFPQARQDYIVLAERIQTLVEIPDLDPVTFLDFERQEPFSGRLTAPYRLDCAVTYRLSSGDQDGAAPEDRVTRELTTIEWQSVLDKAWDAGIPHIIFTGGEPTLREDLVDLITHAEKLGQVTGLLSDGLKFNDRSKLETLLQAGLDHLMIIMHPDSDKSWQAVENALDEDLSLTAHFTITPENQEKTEKIINRLKNIGVSKISLSAMDDSLSSALHHAREWVASCGLELVWNIPVPYSSLHPVALEVGDAMMEGAGRAWLYVEPDGDVRPAQGDSRILGNLLNDPFEKIWKG